MNSMFQAAVRYNMKLEAPGKRWIVKGAAGILRLNNVTIGSRKTLLMNC
jgi:hypothetical protein